MAKGSPNITELAARLNLSKGTVSRILNDESAPFSADTRRRVVAVAAELGYRPNPIARALATGRTGFVALSLPNLMTAYHARVATFCEEHVESESYRMLINLQGWGPAPEGEYWIRGSVDGIIAHGVNTQGWQQPVQNGSRRTAIVDTGVFYDPELTDFVGVDISQTTRQAVEHLLAPGRNRVAYVTHNLPRSASDPRYIAYHSVMTEAGLPLEYITVPGESRRAVRDCVREYVKAHGCPEALFCHNDDTAVAAYRALSDLGLRVPEDAALVGCDGIEDTEYLPVPISTIVQPLDEMCRLAWQYLKRRIQDPDVPPQRTILRSELVIRESSGTRPVLHLNSFALAKQSEIPLSMPR